MNLNNQGDTSNILKHELEICVGPLFQFQFLLHHLCQAANLEIGSEAERTVFFLRGLYD